MSQNPSESFEKLPGIAGFSMAGQRAIVTGGSKGLGLAMAQGLASCGASVMIASRHVEQASSSAAAIADHFSVPTLAASVDVTKEEDCRNMVDLVEQRWGGVDILINSAGINIRGPIESLSLDQFHQVMETNVTGTWLATRAAVGLMKANGYGRIIQIASTLGMVGLAGRTPYASSKGAIVQMTRTLALELAEHGITCNAICPGPFLTEMNLPIADSEDTRKFLIGAVAMGRWGRLEEIQGAAIYLASRAASFTTGSLLVVDGGWTAR
jgi:NAD(P)-dependent dehydrogenase (short-subunit alcohol dehydrogenase family)